MSRLRLTDRGKGLLLGFPQLQRKRVRGGLERLRGFGKGLPRMEGEEMVTEAFLLPLT